MGFATTSHMKTPRAIREDGAHYPHPIQRRTRLIASITGTENARSAQSQPHRGFSGMKR